MITYLLAEQVFKDGDHAVPVTQFIFQGYVLKLQTFDGGFLLLSTSLRFLLRMIKSKSLLQMVLVWNKVRLLRDTWIKD